ncbi:MAG TPA: trimethylamine methyltransferase family protein, partial [Steroidobacteraceae bacterium]
MQRALRTGRRPRPPVAENQTPLDAGLHDGATAPYEPIPAGQVEQLIDAALVLMRDSGVAFEPGSEGLAILGAAGCAVSADGVVRFEPDLVREALASVARSARLWNRDGTHALELDCRHTWFLPGMTCIKVYDLESGEPRDS